MKIKDQVCTLEQSKKLKELGIVSLGVWSWRSNQIQDIVTDTPMVFLFEGYKPPDGTKYYSAYNVAELGEMITATLMGSTFWIRHFHDHHIQLLKGNEKVQFDGNTEAECRAALLIHLLESWPKNVGVINQTITSK